MAERLKRPQSFVSKYETGERRLDVVEFLEVAEALAANSVTSSPSWRACRGDNRRGP